MKQAIKKIITIKLFSLCAVFALATAAQAATFTVNTTADTQDASAGNGICADASGNCSLRAAIREANALAGADTINVPAGTYTQTLTAANENANAGGDWDITSDITLSGAGAATTILQAAATRGTATERVLHIPTAGVTVGISNLTVRFGNLTNRSGGGISADAGSVTLTGITADRNNTTIDNNATTPDIYGGGGIYGGSGGRLTVNNSIISNNILTSSASLTQFQQSGGGVLLANNTASIDNTTINNNSSVVPTGFNSFTSGGGIAIGGGTATISNSLIDANFTSNFGGGIRLTNNRYTNSSAILTITGTTVSGNSTGSSIIGGTGTGGGISLGAIVVGGDPAQTMVLNLNNSTVRNNTSLGNGGGIRVTSVGDKISTANITNSTVSGNSAPNGAGIGTNAASTVNVNFSTVAGNTASASGGGINNGGTVNLQNSVVADNSATTSGADIFGTIVSQGYNLIENTAGGTFTATTGDQTGADPQLGALANNGGTTQTHLPAQSSTVVNTIPSGTNGCGTTVTTDQRGQIRPQQNACDKGAVEVMAATAASVSVTGRALTASGRGIRNVTITIYGGNLSAPRTVSTSSFGYYRFDDLAAGQTYILEVRGKRYSFTNPTRIVSLMEDLTEENFIAEQ